MLSAAYRTAWLERATPADLAATPRATADWNVTPALFTGALARPAAATRSRRFTHPAARSDAAPADKPADPTARAVAKTLTPVLANVREMTLAAIRIVDAHGTVVAATADADLGRA